MASFGAASLTKLRICFDDTYTLTAKFLGRDREQAARIRWSPRGDFFTYNSPWDVVFDGRNLWVLDAINGNLTVLLPDGSRLTTFHLGGRAARSRL